MDLHECGVAPLRGFSQGGSRLLLQRLQLLAESGLAGGGGLAKLEKFRVVADLVKQRIEVEGRIRAVVTVNGGSEHPHRGSALAAIGEVGGGEVADFGVVVGLHGRRE